MAVMFDLIFTVYLFIINGTAFAVMGMDKWKARRGKWRIPEKTLFMLAFLGGSVGSLAGMYGFRHKTKHRKFTVGMPVIFVLWLAAIVLVRFWM